MVGKYPTLKQTQMKTEWTLDHPESSDNTKVHHLQIRQREYLEKNQRGEKPLLCIEIQK